MPLTTPFRRRRPEVVDEPSPELMDILKSKRTTIAKRGSLSSYWRQLLVLLKRNFILHYRWKRSTLAQIVIGPLAFLLLLFVLQKGSNSVQLQSNLHPTGYTLDGVKTCIKKTDDDGPCINMMFTPDTPENRQILTSFANANAKRTSQDVWQFEQAFSDNSSYPAPTRKLGFVPVTNATYIYNYVIQNPNTTVFGIEFSTIPGSSTNASNYRYQVWFNASLVASGTEVYSKQILSLQRGIDEAIIATASNSNPTINITTKAFPKVPPGSATDNIISSLGPVFFFCSEMVIFISVLNIILGEKELRLRRSLEMIGMNSNLYYLSWFLSHAVLTALCAIVTICLALAFDFTVFRQTNFGVLFFVFWLFGMAMVAMAFFVTTLMRTTQAGVLFGIFLFVIGLLFEGFVFSNSFVGFIWWDSHTSIAGWLVLMFIPFFNFGKLFADLSIRTTGYLNELTNTYVPGGTFHWSDIYTKIPPSSLPSYGTDNRKPNVPVPAQALYFLLMNIAFYLLLTWYFDKVIPDEFGVRQSPIFFLLPSYWRQRPPTAIDIDAIARKTTHVGGNEEEEDVIAEKNLAKDPSAPAALRILGLRKVFAGTKPSGCCGCLRRRSKAKVAVQDLHLTVRQGQLLALLGQNGAGKSTTMNMLSGLMRPDGGDAIINGRSIKTDMPYIRSELGVCPQHDILFDDLTALEHIELYGGIKGISADEMDAVCLERLTSVSLWNVRNKKAGEYSGGMKRRLSLVLATLGDPKVIFLDEPTTGMDSKNRRRVWQAIENMKAGRVIVLTTHDLQEADVLAQKVCVLAHGAIVGIGTSMHLKSKIGGYRVSMVTEPSKSATLVQEIASLIPNANLEDESAGSLIYQLSREEKRSIPAFVKYLEEHKGQGVKAWGLSQTSLEQIFLGLIRQADKYK